MRNVQEKLIHTIEETIHIAQEGREKRLQVEEELLAMEEDLKGKLTSLAEVKRDGIIAGASTSPSLAESSVAPSSAKDI